MTHMYFMRYLLIILLLFLLGFFVYRFAPFVPSDSTESVIDTEDDFTEPPIEDKRTRVFSDQGEQLFLDIPLPGEVIHSPLVVKGQARGVWFFEASFPLILVDWDGKMIAEGYAQAQADWMTTSYVPFEGTLEFISPAMQATEPFNRGALILQKDNPSGLPENDDAVEVPVKFVETE